MCEGGRLLADFTAGGADRPVVPDRVAEALTATADGRWVVWAQKAAVRSGNGFLPVNPLGGWYPRVAAARCWRGQPHEAPDPSCTCGFHAVSAGAPLPFRVGRDLLDVALYGRVLAFEWLHGVLFRAAEQAVLRGRSPGPGTYPPAPGRAGLPAPRAEGARARLSLGRGFPGDEGTDRARRAPTAPRGSGPIRLPLPVGPRPVVAVQDDAGACRTPRRVPTAPGRPQGADLALV